MPYCALPANTNPTRQRGNLLCPRSRFGLVCPPRRGSILLIVLIIVVLMTLAAYQFSELVMAEYRAAESVNKAAQARALADSGIHFAAAVLSNADSFATVLENNPYDNASVFSNVQVMTIDEAKQTMGRFSVVAPLDPDSLSSSTNEPFRYGVIDEGGKINLNALLQLDSSGQIAHDMLMLLPNMTEDIVNSILDWIDPDDEPRASGAESSLYGGLNPAYSCKNGPLDSLEELLFVRGVTPQLLLGNDRNRNGILEPDEDDGTGVIDRGWAAYLTVYSREQNLDSTNAPRIYVNDSDLQNLYNQLQTIVSADVAAYIIAYRLYGAGSASSGSGSSGSGTSGAGTSGSGSSGSGGSGGSTSGGSGGAGSSGSSSSATSAVRVDPATAQNQVLATLSQGGAQGQAISSLYALASGSVTVPVPATTPNSSSTSVSFPSPLADPAVLAESMPILLDKLTTVNTPELPPRINVNTAPQAVLATLPGLTDTDIEAIIASRPDPSLGEPPDTIYSTTAWLMTEASLSASKLQSLEKYITARSQVYRVQSVGYFDGGGPTARIEAIVDTNAGRPRIVYWRDLSQFGKGYNLQQ